MVVNLGHRPETITRVIGDGAHLGLRVRYSWEQPALGSAGGPRRALPLLETETFIIVNGDTLSDVALGPMIDAHRASGAEATLAVVPNPRPDHYNGIVLDDDDRITGFEPKGQADGTWHFVGVQVANASVFASLPDGIPAETISGIYRDRVTDRAGAIRGWRVTTPFLDVGTPRDYLDAAQRLGRADGDQSLIDSGARVDPTAHLTGSVVWSGARIGEGAVLEDCIVTGGAAVPPGLRVRGVAIIPATASLPDDRAEIHDGVALFQF